MGDKVPVLYVNVNEEGEAYQASDDQEVALQTLAEFPNDTVVVVVPNSPAATTLLEPFDTESSAGRQHFIDTGIYLLRGETF